MSIEHVRSPALLLSLLVLLGSTGCDTDPARGKTAATVGSARAASQPAAGIPYAFGNDGSELSFVGAKITRKHDGSFAGFRGTVLLLDGDPAKSSVRAEIDLDTLSVDEPRLTGHLKTADFFDVARFPHATFTSTSVAPGGPGGATHTITGNLDLHGITKSITFPATIRVAAETVEADAEFAIDRKDFGIVYPGKPDDLIKDEVLIRLKIRARRA